MRALAVVSFLALTTGVFAQTVTRNFGSVVFPGGTSSTPGVTRNFGSVVFPGGAAVPPVRGGGSAVTVRPPAPSTVRGTSGQNFRRTTPAGRNNRSASYVYAYPVYVGGAYEEPAPAAAAAPPPQNITVVYPPAQHATPVMIQEGPDGEYRSSREGATVYEAPRRAMRREAAEEPPAEPAESNRYLLAFKDHTIYSAVAYWADGDTLHYFTSGNTHNQVSVSLIDRELTERLNRELGTDFKLPPAK